MWYKKLAKSGFEDIETDEQHLKVWSSKFARKTSLDSWQAKASYYTMATNFLNDYPFETPRERIIWEYHANGLSVRDIAITLNKVARSRRTKTNRTTVWLAVKRLESIMYRLYNMKGTDQ